MKKKRVILLGALSASCICAIALTSVMTSGGSNFLSASNDETWSHYNRVANGIAERGIKEYWVSCSSHTHQFTAPAVDPSKIQEKGAPSREFIDSLGSGDDRLLDPYLRVYDFEDQVIPTFFVNNNIVTNKEISDDGTDGSKCLKISVKAGDFQFGFNKEYLDAAFANTAIKAVAFDAKGTVASENWRYNTPQGEPHATSANQPFENYNSGKNGIFTDWKTFYFTRKMYNSWQSDSWMVKGATGESTIYIDNIRPVTYDIYNNITQYGFETNSLSSSKNDTFTAKRGGSNTNALTVTGAGVVTDSWSYSYDKKTEGNRSVKFTKQSGYLAVSIETNIINAIPGDYVVFDMYGPAMNSYDDNKGITDGMNNAFNCQTPGNKWYTLALKKNDGNNGAGSQITKDGRILTMGGSGAGDFYIDNIRGLNEFDSFETAYAFKAGEYGYGLDYRTEHTEAAGNTIRDVNKNYSFLVNGAGCANTEITSEKCSKGNRSVKYTWSKKGYCAMFINPQFLNTYLPKGFSISFDIWASTSFTGGTFMGNAVNSHIGEWTTVTLKEENFEFDKDKGVYNGRFSTASFNGAGAFYIDNLQLIAPQA